MNYAEHAKRAEAPYQRQLSDPARGTPRLQQGRDGGLGASLGCVLVISLRSIPTAANSPPQNQRHEADPQDMENASHLWQPVAVSVVDEERRASQAREKKNQPTVEARESQWNGNATPQPEQQPDS